MTNKRLNQLAYRAKLLDAKLVADEEREACAKEEDGLHVAVCQAVALLNISPEVARCASGREANNILRQALANYHMDQPVPEKERNVIASRHRKAIRARGNGES